MIADNRYAVQLDGVRFAAVCMVMVAHWAQWQFTNPLITQFPFVHGVILFFLLSGFLITRILLNGQLITGSRRTFVRNFYIRRILRIFPVYYILILTLFIIDYKNTRIVFPWLISYTSNMYQSLHNEFIGDFNHFWSLAVEEQFYLFWPLLLVFLPRNKTLTIILSSITLSVAFRLAVYFTNGNWMMISYSTPGCMYALGLGALLAYLTRYKQHLAVTLSRPEVLYVTAVVYLVVQFLAFRYSLEAWKQVGDEVFFAVLSALIILRAAAGQFRYGMKWILEHRWVNYAGRISYGLYVYHLFIPTLYYFLFPKLGISITNKYTLFMTFFLLTFGVAHFSWVLLEAPINRLKSKFPYSG